MSQSLGLGYDPNYEGFDPQYPFPPRVHWLALLVGWIAVSWLIDTYVPKKYEDLLQSLVVDGWVFYLCHWIKRLNPNAKSPFWCDVYVVVQLASSALPEFGVMARLESPSFDVLLYALWIAWVILGIATVFLVRHDLQDHYNNREHAGLVLNGALTFFCSFLYFQHHLYDIGERKRKAQSQMTGQLS